VFDTTALRAEVDGRASPRIFIGGDDHVGFTVHNVGRDIAQLAIDMSYGDRWPDHHDIGMGSSANCQVDAAITGFDCGPLKSGETISVILRAFPEDVGTFHFGARFFDRAAHGLEEIRDPQGGALLVTFDEEVVPISGQIH
jgi:hypothetical protein